MAKNNKQQKKTIANKATKPVNKKAKITKKKDEKEEQQQKKKKIIEEPIIEDDIEEEEEEEMPIDTYNDDDDDIDDDDDNNNGEELTFKKDGFMNIGENDDIDAVIAAIRAEDGDTDDDDDVSDGDVIRDMEFGEDDDVNEDDDDGGDDDDEEEQDYLEEGLDDDVTDDVMMDDEERKEALRAQRQEEKLKSIEKLKEEERLYKSHLFKLQIEALIKEWTPEYDGAKGLATQFNSWLDSTLIPALKGFAEKDALVPTGSFAARMMTVHEGKKPAIDVAVKIPESAFVASEPEKPSQKKNQKGKKKQQQNNNNNNNGKAKTYEEYRNDYMKKFSEILGKKVKLTTVNGRPALSAGAFDVIFYPAISKATYDRYANDVTSSAAAARDYLCAESAAFLRKCTLGCRGLRDAVVLLKAWLHQRGMTILNDVIGNFPLALLMGKLTDDSRANRQMTSYQLFMLAMETFGSGRLTPSATDPVIHRVEFMAHMTPQALRELQQEARATIECLKNDVSPEGGFPETFLTRVDPAWKYDCVLNVDAKRTRATAAEIVAVLMRGLGRRCFLIREIPGVEHIAVGFVLDPAECVKCVERGPSADNVEGSKEFCDVWKERAEVRHFKDGSIVQSVVFDVDDDSQRHTIIKEMCLYLLKAHFSIKERDVNFSCSELDSLIPGETRSIQLVSDFDSLAKKLKELPLPLRLRSVHATSPALRYTSVCVPEPLARHTLKAGQAYIPTISGVLRFEGSSAWPTDDEEAIRKVKTALFVRISESLQSQYMIDSFAYDDHIEVIYKGMVYSLAIHHPREITLWRSIDPAVAEEMDRQCVQAPLHHAAVHGAAVKYHAFTKTVRLFKRWVSAHYFSDYLSEELIELLVTSCFTSPAPENAPQTHIAAFYRVLSLVASLDTADFPNFVVADFENDFDKYAYKSALGQRNYAKEHRSNEDNSLFVAASYAKSRNIWRSPPNVVMKRMVIFAKKCAEMTKALIMSPRHMTSVDWQGIFNHDLSDYDVIVTLDPYKIPTLPLALPWQATAAALKKVAAREEAAVKRARQAEALAEGIKNPPLAGFDPCTLLCDALRKVYGGKALFFRNALGGEHIGVVWRPGALAARKWSVKDTLSVMPAEKGNDFVEINVPEVVRDIKIMGSGLVKSVSVKDRK